MSTIQPGHIDPNVPHNNFKKDTTNETQGFSTQGLTTEILQNNLTTLLNKLDNMQKSVNLKNQDEATKTRIENLLESRISPIKNKCEEIRGQLPTSPTILNNLGTEDTKKLEGLFKQLETLVKSYQKTIKEEPIIIEKDLYVDLEFVLNSSSASASPLFFPYALSSGSAYASKGSSGVGPSNKNTENVNQDKLDSFKNNLRTKQSNIAALKQQLETTEANADKRNIPLDQATISLAERQLEQLDDNFAEILKLVDTEVENITPEVIKKINLKIGSCIAFKTALSQTLGKIYEGQNELSQMVSDGDISMAVSMVTFSIPGSFSMSASNLINVLDQLQQK